MGLKEKLTLEKFEEACEAVGQVTLDTSLIYSDYFSERTGGKVYLKPENRQRTGAYKVRGAYYKISTLSEEERARGLITASAGNHAQGVAYAAQKFGAKAVIVMPTTTPLIKVNRTKALGAEVVLFGDVYDEACEKAYELAEEHGYTFIHPFDDRHGDHKGPAPGGHHSGPRGRRRTCHRRLHTGQDAQTQYESHRSRA